VPWRRAVAAVSVPSPATAKTRPSHDVSQRFASFFARPGASCQHIPRSGNESRLPSRHGFDSPRAQQASSVKRCCDLFASPTQHITGHSKARTTLFPRSTAVLPPCRIFGCPFVVLFVVLPRGVASSDPSRPPAMIDSAISLLARVNHLEQSSPYGYVPGKAPGYAYVVVFGVGLVLHIGLAVRYKYWIAMVTLIPGGLCE
jgi:hypothetical protein